MTRHPPDILITTPESLYLMLTSRAREIFAGAEAVILDEIHAVAQTKRGAHMALTLERLELAADGPVQRIGLSATQNPLEEVGRFMVGPKRTCRVVDAGVRKPLDLKIHVPVESMVEPEQSDVELDPFAGAEATRKSIWPAIYPEILELVRAHTSTIVFVNNRRGAERLALRLNELASHEDPDGPAVEIARAHHGSLAREERLVIEDQLKAGELPCLVATSSLELGIDMGAVDLVLQVESPKSVTRGLQRIGRAGHNVGDTSKGRIFPKFRADLLECAVVAQRMREGLIETTVVPRNPLDVLAQQVVAMAASADDEDQPLVVDDLHALLQRTYSFAELSRQQPRERARHARRPLPERGVRRAAPADRLGPRGRDDPRPQGLARAGDHQRRHDPRPRPVLGQPPRRPPRRRARRGDGLRGAPGPDVPARRHELADRGHHPRPRRRHARPRRAGRGAVLARRQRRAPARARRGDRRVRALGRRAGRQDARGGLRPRPPRRPEPARLPARAAGRHARRAERPHDRRRALPRRDRRLAAVHPLALRRPRARGLGPRAERPHPRRVRARVRRDLVRRRDHRPPARRRRAARRRARADRPRRARGQGRRRARRLRPVRLALPRERRPRAADPARLPGQAHAAVAAAPEVADAARGRQALRPVPDRARDLPRVPARRARRPRPAGPAAAAALARARPGRDRDADRLAVRLLAAVRLRRDLHVRGRHAQRGAPRRRPGAGPRAAARAARPGGAARADRPGRARAGRGRPAAHVRAHPRGLRRRPARRAAPGRRPHARGGAGAVAGAATGPRSGSGSSRASGARCGCG